MTENRPLRHWQRNTATTKSYDGVINQKRVRSSISTSFQMLTEKQGGRRSYLDETVDDECLGSLLGISQVVIQRLL